MKNILKYSMMGLAAALCTAGCSDWVTPERNITQTPEGQSPILRDNAYYEALREYKKTRHKIAFGWYGSWTATGASYQTRLQSAPDSMDIISIWSQWHSLTKEQLEDMHKVQELKGTKVTFTVFLNNLPDEFKIDGETTDEGIENLARSYCRDSIDKYGYDGIDIDYEPGYGAVGEFVGHDNEQFKKLILAMGKYVGPKSGTGKLFMIDGVPYAVHEECAEYFDYGIVQAYASSGYDDLQNRFNNADAKGWKPGQYIFAENFESYWKNGGVTHKTRDGESVNSLLGMARFNPTQGFAGGFGAYHMEYEYGNIAMPYEYMRRAIQDVNPAGGDIKVNFESSSTVSLPIIIEDDGSLSGNNATPIVLGFSRPLSAAVSFQTSLENDLVSQYNEENETSYLTVDASKVHLEPVTAEADTIKSAELVITVDPSGLAEGKYLIPVRVNIPEDSGFVSDSDLVKYIFLSVARVYVDINATEVTGTKIAPADGWMFNCYQQENTSGANGVWNEVSSQMFDGSYSSGGWYTYPYSYAWGYGGNFIVQMDKAYDVTGIRWYRYYTGDKAAITITDVQYSNDRTHWESLLNGTSFSPASATNDGGYMYRAIQFKKSVNAMYVRVIVSGSFSGYISMSEVEIYGPEN